MIKNVAIIPARGGSKRIPRKNIKLFHGHPVLKYAIDTAQQSGCFTDIFVSTDDDEIKAISESLGAKIVARPSSLADDYTGTMEVIQHAIEDIEKRGYRFENLCCLYPATPLLHSYDIVNGLTNLEASESIQYVFSAQKYTYPIQRSLKLSENGEVSMSMPEFESCRSQDLQESYHDAGQFYWGKKDAFKRGKKIFSKHSRIVELPTYRARDIDTPEDWLFAELLYEKLMREQE